MKPPPIPTVPSASRLDGSSGGLVNLTQVSVNQPVCIGCKTAETQLMRSVPPLLEVHAFRRQLTTQDAEHRPGTAPSSIRVTMGRRMIGQERTVHTSRRFTDSTVHQSVPASVPSVPTLSRGMNDAETSLTTATGRERRPQRTHIHHAALPGSCPSHTEDAARQPIAWPNLSQTPEQAATFPLTRADESRIDMVERPQRPADAAKRKHSGRQTSVPKHLDTSMLPRDSDRQAHKSTNTALMGVGMTHLLTGTEPQRSGRDHQATLPAELKRNVPLSHEGALTGRNPSVAPIGKWTHCRQTSPTSAAVFRTSRPLVGTCTNAPTSPRSAEDARMGQSHGPNRERNPMKPAASFALPDTVAAESGTSSVLAEGMNHFRTSPATLACHGTTPSGRLVALDTPIHANN